MGNTRGLEYWSEDTVGSRMVDNEGVKKTFHMIYWYDFTLNVGPC